MKCKFLYGFCLLKTLSHPILRHLYPALYNYSAAFSSNHPSQVLSRALQSNNRTELERWKFLKELNMTSFLKVSGRHVRFSNVNVMATLARQLLLMSGLCTANTMIKVIYTKIDRKIEFQIVWTLGHTKSPYTDTVGDFELIWPKLTTELQLPGARHWPYISASTKPTAPTGGITNFLGTLYFSIGWKVRFYKFKYS